MPKNLPKVNKILKPTDYTSCMKNRYNLLKYSHYPDADLTLDALFTPSAAKSTQEKPITDLVQYDKSANNWGKKLQKLGRAEDVFNLLKDMPEEFNIIKGNSVWENPIAEIGQTVLVFPALQVKTIELNDDLEFTKGLLEHTEKINLTSGYFNLPSWFIKALATKDFQLLCASPIVIDI